MGLKFSEICGKIKDRFPDSVLEVRDEGVLQPSIEVKCRDIRNICGFLKGDAELDFDLCESITGVDDRENLWVVYHIYSIRKKHQFILRVKTSRESPSVPSVMSVWRTADWQEREVYDFYGIKFEDHEDLRRILLPEDWKGYPLRKDYEFPEDYDGIPLR